MTTKPAHVCSYLGEADVLGVLSKALTTDVQVVFADDTPFVATHSAAKRNKKGQTHSKLPSAGLYQ